jgi:hypothetical protein
MGATVTVKSAMLRKWSLNVAKAVWGMQSMEVSLGIDEKKLGEAYALGSKIYESNEAS